METQRNNEHRPMLLCPHHKYKTDKILILHITDSNDVNFSFQFCEFQLYNHTQYLGTDRIYQDEI